MSMWLTISKSDHLKYTPHTHPKQFVAWFGQAKSHFHKLFLIIRVIIPKLSTLSFQDVETFIDGVLCAVLDS